MKVIYPKEEYCIGCKLCEIHCIVEHSKSKDIIKAFKKEFPKAINKNIVEKKDEISFCVSCRHCLEAPCITTCMTGAMHRSKKGAVIVDKDKCVGCWMCIMVCPFGVIKRENEKIASKCDLCPDEEIPVCVKNCPNEALVYEER